MAKMGIEKTMVEKNLVFGLARKTPIFVINGRVYYCLDNNSDSNTKSSHRDVFEIKEGPGLEVLERISEKKLAGDYAKFQEDFIKKELNESLNYENCNMANKKLIAFVVNEIFPYLRKDNTCLDNLLNTNPSSQNVALSDPGAYDAEIEKYAQDKIREIETKKKTVTKIDSKVNKLDRLLLNEYISKSNISGSFLLELMNGFNFAVYNEKLFTLANVDGGENISIGGKKYAMVDAGTFSSLQNNFTSETLTNLSLEALREKLKTSEEFKRLKAERSDIDIICKKDCYHEKDFGFESDATRFFVYLDVPEYVLSSPEDGSLYKFDSHKLGIPICFSDGQAVISAGPRSIQSVAGPFYYDHQGLCMGSYAANYFDSMPRGKAIAKYLVDARNVVLKGYRNANVRPVWRLNGSNFGARRITSDEVEKKGLVITNINYQRGGRNVA